MLAWPLGLAHNALSHADGGGGLGGQAGGGVWGGGGFGEGGDA